MKTKKQINQARRESKRLRRMTLLELKDEARTNKMARVILVRRVRQGTNGN